MVTLQVSCQRSQARLEGEIVIVTVILPEASAPRFNLGSADSAELLREVGRVKGLTRSDTAEVWELGHLHGGKGTVTVFFKPRKVNSIVTSGFDDDDDDDHFLLLLLF